MNYLKNTAKERATGFIYSLVSRFWIVYIDCMVIRSKSSCYNFNSYLFSSENSKGPYEDLTWSQNWEVYNDYKDSESGSVQIELSNISANQPLKPGPNSGTRFFIRKQGYKG